MRKTGGQALAEGLIQHGITDLFMIPGVQLDWAVEALRQRGDAITLTVPRHEQTTTYMADGYYRASGRVGAAMVVPGPGVLNTGAGLATAYACNARVLLLTAQIHSEGVGKGYGLLHEIKDQTGFIAGLTKWNAVAASAQDIAPTLDAAFAQLHHGRSRPVGVEVPHDFLNTEFDADAVHNPHGKNNASGANHANGIGLPDTGDTTGASTSDTSLHTALEPVPPPSDAVLAQAAKLLNHAKFPVIYAGGGVFHTNAHAALQQLAERIGAPVVMSDNGRGALSDRHPLAMSSLAGRALFAHADVVLVVGSRFIDTLTPTASWPASPGLRFIYLNIDAADVSAPRQPDVTIIADAAVALPQLAQRLTARQVLSTQDAARVKAWAQVQIDAVEPQASYVRALRAAMPDDAIFVSEMTQIGYLGRVAFPVYQARTYISPGYQGTLGYGLPTALGAAVAAKGRRVVAITGDGGFGWNLQELATAQRYRLPVTLVVFNDGHYGNVRGIQQRTFGAEIAVELTNPDFRLLAQAFGVAFEQVDTPAALEGAVKTALQTDGPALIEVRIGEVPSPWHLLRLRPMPSTAGAVAPTAPDNPLGVPNDHGGSGRPGR